MPTDDWEFHRLQLRLAKERASELILLPVIREGVTQFDVGTFKLCRKRINRIRVTNGITASSRSRNVVHGLCALFLKSNLGYRTSVRKALDCWMLHDI